MTRPRVGLPHGLTFVVAVAVCVIVGAGMAITLDSRTPGGTVMGRSIAGSQPASAPAVAQPVPALPPGLLGAAPRFLSGPAGAVAYRGKAPLISEDAGRSWHEFPRPDADSPVIVDAADFRIGLAGGGSLRATADGGRTWTPAKTPPPGPGPWQPLLVSPFDSSVWFLLHDGKLARTRDGATTWRDLTGIPALGGRAGMVPGAAPGQFVLFDDNRLFEFDDNGQTIKALPPLPAGVSVLSLSVSGGTPAAAHTSDSKVYLQKGNGWVVASAPVAGPAVTGVEGVLLIADGRGAVGSAGTVVVSTDAGGTWHRASGLPPDQSVEAVIALDPAAHSLLAYCMGGDVYASTDTGGTWSLASRAFRTGSS